MIEVKTKTLLERFEEASGDENKMRQVAMAIKERILDNSSYRYVRIKKEEYIFLGNAFYLIHGDSNPGKAILEADIDKCSVHVYSKNSDLVDICKKVENELKGNVDFKYS